MSDEQLPSTCKDLNREMAKAAINLVGWAEQLTPAECITPGAEGWSVKDHVAHLDGWLRGMVALLRHENRIAAMGMDTATYLSGDFDRMNDVIQAQHKDESWETVWENYMATMDAFNETVSTLDDADLQRPYSYFQPDEPGGETDPPIVGWLAGNSYLHVQEHLPWMQDIVAEIESARA